MAAPYRIAADSIPAGSVGLTFDAVNLTNSKQQTYYKFEDAGNQDQFNLATTLLSRTFAVGLRYSFD